MTKLLLNVPASFPDTRRRHALGRHKSDSCVAGHLLDEMRPRTSFLLLLLLSLLVAVAFPPPAPETESKVRIEDETGKEHDESWTEWAREKITGGLGIEETREGSGEGWGGSRRDGLRRVDVHISASVFLCYVACADQYRNL